MSKIRQSTTQINFKNGITLGRVYIPTGGASVPAGGFFARISSASFGLANYKSNLVITGTTAFFSTADSNINGHITKVDLATPAVTLSAVQTSGGIYFNTNVSKSLQIDSSNNLLGVIDYNDTNGSNYAYPQVYNQTTLVPTTIYSPNSSYFAHPY